MNLKIILAGLMYLCLLNAQAQGLTCAEAAPFCTGTTYDFPAGTTGAAETGPYYGCLSSQPCPAWYYLKIGDPGSLTIYMHSVPQYDIDFACWGPYTDPTSACPYGLTIDKMVSCCYCNSWEETCQIPNGQTGEYYILLITNFSQQACNILFSQTGGTGSTDCSILPPPVSNDGPLCVGDTLHLNAETVANATYEWTGAGGFTSTDQNPVIPNITLANAGDYSCVITVYGQTSTPAITTVVINDLPDALLLSYDTTTCPGAPSFMLVNLTGAGPFEVTYYDGSAYFIASGLTGPVDTIYLYPPGPAAYSLTGVSDSNCTKALSGVTFQVYNFTPPIGVLSGDATICQGDTAQLVFNLTGSPPWAITYLINGSNPQTVTAYSSPYILTVTPLVTTHYQFTQVSDANCAGTASGQALVTVDLPTGFLSGDNTICAGGGAQLIFILTGYPPWTITYTANGTDEQTLTATYSPFSIPVSPSVSTLYEFTVLQDVFCLGTAGGQAMIIIYQPAGELSGSSTICAGETAEITFDLSGNPPWIITYTENGGDPQTVTAYSMPYNLSVTPPVTTLYEFTYFEDNSCPGIPSGEALVTVNPNPSVSAGPDKTIPNGTSTLLEGEVTGGSGSYGYQWQPADKVVDAQLLQPMTVNLSSSTLFTMTGTDNSGGCYESDEVLVTVTGGVLSCNSTAGPNSICRGETSQLQAIASGGSGNFTYLWQSDPPGFSSNIQNPSVIPDQSTTYSVTVNDGYNIVHSTVTVTVHQLPVPEAGSDQMIIYGTTAVLQGSAGSGSGLYNYHWEPSYKLVNPDVANPATVNLYETTLFTLSVTDAQTGCACCQADAVAIMISGSALNVNPSASPGTICSGDSTQLFSLEGGGTGYYTHSWTSSPPGFISSLSDPTVQPLESTVYTVVISDGYNNVSGSVGVTVNPSPLVLLGGDTTVCVFETVTIDAGNEGASYLWSNGSTEKMISVGTTGIGYDSKTFYVTVTSSEGCMTTAHKKVTFDFTACTGINEQFNESGLRLYPNPGSGLVNIEETGDGDFFKLTVIDWTGRELICDRIIDLSGSEKRFILDLKPYPSGIYLVKMFSDKLNPVSIKYVLIK